ncbi:MAG: DUF4249 domain-containing protein [Bacteroidales bacterium]|nr:DUF4249 domain-containing protein [Bacteroidales bacterium]
MKIKNFILITVISLAVLTACRDEFLPEVTKYENLLVVDGMITNDPGPYSVELSLSSKVDNPHYIPYTGCDVTIHEKGGVSEQLIEYEQGVYKTSPDGIRGMVGNEYKLSIKTPEGKQYESDYQKLRDPIAIDSIYHKLKRQKTTDYDHDLVGYQFYVNTETGNRPGNYFLWQLEETYEYNANYKIEYIFDGSISSMGNSDTVYTCWKTQKVNDFFVAETASLSTSHISDYPLHYVTTQTKQLQVKYSLLANQLIINEDAYQFWKQVKDQVSEESYLFSKQPFQIRGNIRNAKNEQEPVLGYFTVAGSSKKRIYADSPRGVEFYYMDCYADPDLRALGYIPPSEYPVYLTIADGGPAIAPEPCFDCTFFGGKLTKPDFWPN